jgi:cell division inhibitor SulA/protein ImuA
MLDAALPGNGWPLGALVEIIVPQHGLGELRLLLPAMARLSARREIAWIDPPFIPYAQALIAQGVNIERLLVVHPKPQDFLWTTEQLLRVCGMTLSWPGKASWNTLRRLQLAAAGGRNLGVLFTQSNTGASPAALRLKLRALHDGLEVSILKARGPAGCVQIPLP